jgi:hypothetical protein
MIDLGSTEFVLVVPSIPRSELELHATRLFDSWESVVGQSLALPDYSLFLQLEEGSISGRAKIAAALGALYLGIADYGGFISGLGTIRQQVVAVGDYVAERAARHFSCPDSRATIKKRGGSLTALHRLFVKVQKGELSADEATRRAEELLGDDSADEPRFIKELERSLHNCQRFPKQQPLPFSASNDEIDAILGPPSQPHRPPRPKSEVGPPLHWRVEVWRDSKKKNKQTKITRL